MLVTNCRDCSRPLEDAAATSHLKPSYNRCGEAQIRELYCPQWAGADFAPRDPEKNLLATKGWAQEFHWTLF